MRLFCCLCLIWNLSLAHSSEPLDFSQLEEFMLGNNKALAEMQGKRVTIRGFLFRVRDRVRARDRNLNTGLGLGHGLGLEIRVRVKCAYFVAYA